MNYLAHLALSPDDKPSVRLGNFIADSIRPVHLELFDTEVSEGYHLHIEIDRFTDQHLSFKKVVQMLRARHGKYAPVVADILLDHLLATDWKSFYDLSFFDWEKMVYAQLSTFETIEFPQRARKLYNGLMSHRYLPVYLSKEGITDVLQRMDKRAKFTSFFQKGTEDLYSNYSIMKRCFTTLYNDLQKEFEQ